MPSPALCLCSVLPFPCYTPSCPPFPSVPDVPRGHLPPPYPCPTPPSGTGWRMPCVQTQKPRGGVCGVWRASWTCKHMRPRWQRGPGSSPHSPGRQACPWPWQQRGGRRRQSGPDPHGPTDSPGGCKQPSGPDSLHGGLVLGGGAGAGGPVDSEHRSPSRARGGGAGWDLLTCRAPELCPAVTGPQRLAPAPPPRSPAVAASLQRGFIQLMCRGGQEDVTGPASRGETWASPSLLTDPGPSAAERGWWEGRGAGGAPAAEPEQM